MADASVTVEVKTTSDLAGLKQVQSEVTNLLDRTKEHTQEQLKAVGLYQDAAGAIRKIPPEVEKVTQETKNAAAGMDLFKVNTSKALGEAQVLIRELATGSFHARTLGSLMSALGTGITAAGIAAILLFETFKSIVEQAIKLREETAKGNEELIKLAHNWEQLAATVRTTDEMVALTRSFTAEITKLDEQIGSLVRKSNDVTGLRRGLLELFKPTTGAPALGSFLGLDKPIADLLTPESDKLLAAKEKQREAQTLVIAKNVEEAKTMQDLALQFPHTQKFLDDLIDAEGVYIDAQNRANTETKDGQIAYAKATEQLGQLQNVINSVAAANKVLDDEAKKSNAEVEQMVKVGNQHLEQRFKEEQAERDLAQALIPTREQQSLILDQIVQLQVQQAGLNRNIQSENQAWLELESRIRNLDTAYRDISGTINAVTENIAKLNAEVNKQVEKGNTGLQAALDLEKKINAEAAVRNAEGNKELTINEKVNQEKLKTHLENEAVNKAAGTTVISDQKDLELQNIAGESLRHQLEVREGMGKAQSTLNVEMKQYETILQNIRQQQTVAKDQSFVGVDQQNLQLLRLYRQEITNIIAAMRQQEARKGSLTDPAEIAKANQELQKFSAQYQVLAAKIITTQHQFAAGLQSWANSFGSTGTQLANTLQQTVGAALQSFNQWIVTGKFNMQALLQQIAQLGLQLVEQLLIQQAVGLITARLAETQAVASSQIIAAAWAGAATAATIATQGEAALNAPWQVAAALGGVQAALGIGKLHEGGAVESRRMHSGGLAHDEVPIIAQEGEIMINRDDAARHHDLLMAINAGQFHDGGFIAGERYHRGSDWSDVGSNIFGPNNVFENRFGPDFSGFSDYDPSARMTLERLAGFGFLGGIGTPGFLQGSTMIPTTFDSGGYPFAVQAALPPSDTGTSQQLHAGFQFKPKHGGGEISRMHSGGSVSRSGSNGGGIHIYAFTDLKQLTKHMSSREGQKIIFDTVKGRRIDLGMK